MHSEGRMPNTTNHPDGAMSEPAKKKPDDHSGHSHAPADFGTAFTVGILLNTAFVAIEALYGLKAHSLALVADAGHNFSDVLGLLMAWAASRLALRPPSKSRTYGLRRSSVLAALANAIFLLVAIGAIAWEAIGRFRHPTHVAGGTVMAVAAIGIAINGITALLFMRGRKGDLNIRGAFLHMAADAAVSAGVVVAGAVVVMTGWLAVDPIVSLLIVLVVGVSTWGLLKDSVNLALDAVPAGIDPTQVESYLAGIAGVTEVHDLHIWGMSTTHTALTVHLVKPGVTDEDALLSELADHLHSEFGIDHGTVQIERGRGPHGCRLSPADVV